MLVQSNCSNWEVRNDLYGVICGVENDKLSSPTGLIISHATFIQDAQGSSLTWKQALNSTSCRCFSVPKLDVWAQNVKVGQGDESSVLLKKQNETSVINHTLVWTIPLLFYLFRGMWHAVMFVWKMLCGQKKLVFQMSWFVATMNEFYFLGKLILLE